MSNYTKTTNFTAKDALSTGDPEKIVEGAELDTEFNALATAVNSKADKASPTLTGTITINGTTVAGNATVSGDNTYSGASTFSNTVTITGALSQVPAGVMFPYAGASAPTGFLLCDGAAVSRTTYSLLYTAISTTYGVGDGSTTFNIPDTRGRIPLGAGTGTLAEAVAAGDVSAANDTFIVASNATKWITGMKVQLTTTVTLPTGLSLATDYYIIRASATTIKFATTLADAIAGTVVDITTQGSGNHTVTHTLTARTLGEKLGEETHGLVIAEIPSHTHTYESTGDRTGQYVGSSAPGPTTYPTGTTDPTGGSDAHNLMQPSLVVNYIIKT